MEYNVVTFIAHCSCALSAVYIYSTDRYFLATALEIIYHTVVLCCALEISDTLHSIQDYTVFNITTLHCTQNIFACSTTGYFEDTV